jgi:DNA-binding NarL/FixJ family response regulator
VVPCRVFIADDVEALRVLWRQLLGEHPDITVVGDAGDGAAALEGVRATRPDVLVLDLSMPRIDGLEVIRTLRAEMPGTKIVVASGFAASRLEALALELGASAYFEKGGTVEELRAAVLDACRGPVHRNAAHPPSTDG